MPIESITYRDHTFRYHKKGGSLNRFVLTFVRDYVKEHELITFNQLKLVFPDSLQNSTATPKATLLGVFSTRARAEQLARGRRMRFFNLPSERIKLSDGNTIVVTDQWASEGARCNLPRFIEKVRELNEHVQVVPLPEAEDNQMIIRKKVEQQHDNRNNERNMDYTQYKLNGHNIGGKGRLVLAVMSAYHQQNQTLSFDEINRNWEFRRLTARLDAQVERRRFFADTIFTAHCGTKFVVSNQWGVGQRFNAFLERARRFNFDIQPIVE